LQWAAVVEADRQVAVHQAARTARARQVIQVVGAETLDHNHIQDQAVGQEVPQ
jgi:hypothetical protein